MNTEKLLLNFVRQYRKPFSVDTAASLTNLDREELEPILTNLLAEGAIKIISEGIYVKANRYNPTVCYRQKGTWNFHPQSAAHLLDLIEKGNYSSIRKITDDFPRSRQWVYVYLEALASIDVIGFDDKYYVKSRARLKDIGKVVKRGILQELKPKAEQPDPQIKEQRKAEAAERKRLRMERDAALAKVRREMKAYKDAKKAEWEKVLQQREFYKNNMLSMISKFNKKYSS